MSVTVPIEFAAKQYSIESLTTKADGTKLRDELVLFKSCTTAPSDARCVKNAYRTTERISLAPGNYKLTAVVKDTESSTQKNYEVNFAVH
jgi:hypothetical protein